MHQALAYPVASMVRTVLGILGVDGVDVHVGPGVPGVRAGRLRGLPSRSRLSRGLRFQKNKQ